jgi:hypothetical protein
MQLRRHLVGVHRHDVIDDEVRPVPAIYLPWALRAVGLPQEGGMSRASLRRRQRARAAERDRVLAASAWPPPQRACCVQVASEEADGDSWDDSATSSLVDLTRPVAVSVPPVVSVDVAIQTVAGDPSRNVGVQTSMALFHELIPMSVRDIGRLVVDNPIEPSTAIMRRVRLAVGELDGISATLTSMVVMAVIIGSATLADHVRQVANRPLATENGVVVETSEERLRELWGDLSEHQQRP